MKKRMFGLIATALLLSSCGSNPTSSSSVEQSSKSEPTTTSVSSSISITSETSTTTSQETSSSVISSSSATSSSSAASSSSSSASSSEASSSLPESSSSVAPTPVPKEKITIEKVPNISDDFIRGMDASSVISLENSGVSYYDFDGYKKDLFEILANNGVTHIRIRIWNDPYDSSGKGYGGGNNDVATAIAIGKRVTAAGMKTIVDFHYSDFWTDPAKYTVPKAWKDHTISQKETAIYNYTVETLGLFKTNNIDVGIVQIGNEINNGIAGELYSKTRSYTESPNYFALLKQASNAVRYAYPKTTSGVKVAVHYTDPQSSSTNYALLSSNLKNAGVDYDIFGASYYPHQHGSLSTLVTQLNKVVDNQHKEVMVLETSYPNTITDTDGQGNSYGQAESDALDGYPFSIQSQASMYRDICNSIVNDVHDNAGIGVCYWEGAWISVGSTSWSTNYSKWDTYGSGWISKYAKDYDHDLLPGTDGNYYSQGCVIDNQAFFDMYGKPLSSLEVFKYLKNGYYPDGEPATPHSLDITLNLVTPPSGKVNIVYSVNGDDPYLSEVTWTEMSGSSGTYTYTISNLNKDDVVCFRFATWDSSAGSLYICADDTWIGASQTMDNENVSLTCTATSFPTSSSETTIFIVS